MSKTANSSAKGPLRSASCHENDPSNGATTLPVWNSTGFRYSSAEDMARVFEGREQGFVYTRIANPSLIQFERRMAELEGGRIALSFASGMAAISTVLLGLVSSGDEIVSSSSIFGGTYSLFTNLFSRLGIQVKFVDPTDDSAVEVAITDRTRAVFVESLGNPALDVPDIAVLSKVASKHGLVLVVDNTAVTPALFSPIDAGADIVIESASKYINGTGTALGGVMIDSCSFEWDNGRYPHLAKDAKRYGGMTFSAFLRQDTFRDLGGCFNPQGAFMMSAGLDTLSVRMERHCENAAAVAQALDDKWAGSVRYPGLEGHEGYAVATGQFGGRYGGLLTVRLGSRDAAFEFINALEKAMIVANIGDARTLVIHPASTFCREFDEKTRAAMGVHDDLVRISVGIEEPQDLIDDILGAFKKAHK